MFWSLLEVTETGSSGGLLCGLKVFRVLASTLTVVGCFVHLVCMCSRMSCQRAVFGPGEVSPPRTERLIIFILNRKDCQLQGDLDFVKKSSFVLSTNNDSIEKFKNICNIFGARARFRTAEPQ
jgi:hypothetical protein